jgi:hypothetical protein
MFLLYFVFFFFLFSLLQLYLNLSHFLWRIFPLWWDFRFSRRRKWRWQPYGMLLRLVWWTFTDFSEVFSASIISLDNN